MSNLFAHRDMKAVAKASLQFRHYRAAKNMLLGYKRPLDAWGRYLFARGSYPASVPIRSPLGLIEPTLYSFDDMLTVNEIFCRGDYRCARSVKTIVDFGSNIGISALYFLTRSRHSFAYLFEPLPWNVERLRRNLQGFEDRYKISPFAVALNEGEAEFGCEETGRYGGIGLVKERSIRVPCKRANEVLQKIVAERGEIDVLKMDIEFLEREVLLNIPVDLLLRIKNIFTEVVPVFKTNPLPRTHTYRQYGTVARFRRKEKI